MLSMIEVQCPHCGAQGQIMVPPVGSIIIGPCPQCKELVVVFCGQVLPLDKEIMEDGSVQERQEHLLETLTEFLQDRIGTMLTDDPMEEDEEYATDIYEEDGRAELDDRSAPVEATAPVDERPKERAPISQSEFDRFTDVDLKLLDNKAYFKSVFDG